jgi:hypothetical protein
MRKGIIKNNEFVKLFFILLSSIFETIKSTEGIIIRNLPNITDEPIRKSDNFLFLS